MSVPYIGSKISLTSKSDIRYVGVLHSINQQESTVALEQVRSLGTEGRKSNPVDEIPANDQVFDFIVFRASDIKDLQVVEAQSPPAPPAPQYPNDPAILGTTAPARSGFTPAQQPPQNAFGGYAPPVQQPYGGFQQPPPQQPYWQQPPPMPQQHFQQQPPMPQQQPPQQRQQQQPPQPKPQPPQQPQQQTQAQRPPQPPIKPAAVEAAAQKLSQMKVEDKKAPVAAPTTPAKPPTMAAIVAGTANKSPVQNQQQQSQYQQQQQQQQQQGQYGVNGRTGSGYSGRGGYVQQGRGGQRGGGRGGAYYNNRGRGGANRPPRGPGITVPDSEFDFESSNAQFRKEEVVATVDKEESESEDEVVYDKKKSFFDNISCETKERIERDSHAPDRRIRVQEERRLNLETFGQTGYQRYGRGGYRGGRGGYRGGNRGGYRGGYNRGGYNSQSTGIPRAAAGN